VTDEAWQLLLIICDGKTAIKFNLHVICQSRGNSATGWTSGIRFPADSGNFSLRYRVRNSSGAHPASYPRGAGDSFPWV